jgi:hypothetical protein
MKETTRSACHICGSEGEFHRSWPGGGGEMRLCQDCNFVFAGWFHTSTLLSFPLMLMGEKASCAHG